MKKKNNYFNLSESIKSFLTINPFQDIITWAEKNIDFSGDVSAQRNRLDFKKYIYQLAPLKEFEDFTNIKTVTFCAPQQMRKDKRFCYRNIIFNDFSSTDNQ